MKLGEQGEELAVKLLKKKGYKIKVRNYKTRLGEIDIIAVDGNTLVFIEVKTRESLEQYLGYIWPDSLLNDIFLMYMTETFIAIFLIFIYLFINLFRCKIGSCNEFNTLCHISIIVYLLYIDHSIQYIMTNMLVENSDINGLIFNNIMYRFVITRLINYGIIGLFGIRLICCC